VSSTKSSKPKKPGTPVARSYAHNDEVPLRPDVGIQALFRQRKPPAKFRYDSSLDPQLSWDPSADRAIAESLIRELSDCAEQAATPTATASERVGLANRVRVLSDRLRVLGRPYLNWAGKSEHQEFEVPTLPLFVHEHLSTEAILKSFEGRKPQKTLAHFFADSGLDVTDRVLKAYTHKGRWANRLILGDALIVMNSLLRFEGMGGQVQMVYLDPPYGVKFGGNFQPFVRGGDVDLNRDGSITREPEMVQAYRDTWELGLHSYLTYLRDRLLLARELLAPTGSIFVQISDENLQYVRQVVDEIFRPENYCGLIAFRTTGGQSTALLSTSTDFLIWYAKDKEQARRKFHAPTIPKIGGADDGSGQYTMIEPTDGSQEPRPMTREELGGEKPLPSDWRVLAHDTLYSQGAPPDPLDVEFEWRGQKFRCPPNTHWKPGVRSGGMGRLASADRLMVIGNTLRYKRFLNDFPVYLLDNVWDDTARSGFGRKKEYVVETSTKVIERCMLMTTDPGDLVLDPTCGSGTTAYCAEQWGRRWITVDTSRVPLSLTRQRLLTATFPWYTLRDDGLGPAGGFRYERRQNRRGQEIGGIIPHVTLSSVANGEEPKLEVVQDRPESDSSIVRVTGSFAVEATIPAPVSGEDGGEPTKAGGDDYFLRMLEILRRAPVLRLTGGSAVEFRNVRAPARGLDIHAVAELPGQGDATGPTASVAIAFGPENGAVTEGMIVRAVKEANAKNYAHLFVIGFAIQDAATRLLRNSEQVLGMPVTFAQASMDILMGDLLKTTRNSQIFSVIGQPDLLLTKLSQKSPDGEALYQVTVLALDTFNPITMESDQLKGDELPAWMLDSDYDELCFRANQVFFPSTGAWDNLQRALKGQFSDSLWAHLAGTVSEPFVPGERGRVAVKVIDPRGNELMAVLDIKEARPE
jgi:adenine-specific DNA-methyltransferase